MIVNGFWKAFARPETVSYRTEERSAQKAFSEGYGPNPVIRWIWPNTESMELNLPRLQMPSCMIYQPRFCQRGVEAW